MHQTEYIDVLIGTSNGCYIVEKKEFEKGSKEALEATEMLKALALKGMKEGHPIYRKHGDKLVEANLEVDYAYLLELELLPKEGRSIGR
ncbi:MAG: hypothetical protein IJO32_00340 [Bacilli bacterium]|nr:hypothetical protein [Bacilli bacterium]